MSKWTQRAVTAAMALIALAGCNGQADSADPTSIDQTTPTPTPTFNTAAQAAPVTVAPNGEIPESHPQPAPTLTAVTSGDALEAQLLGAGCRMLGEISRYSQDTQRDISTQQWECATVDIALSDEPPAEPGQLIIHTLSPTNEVNFRCEPRATLGLQQLIDETLAMYEAVLNDAETQQLRPPYPTGTSSISNEEYTLTCYSRIPE